MIRVHVARVARYSSAIKEFRESGWQPWLGRLRGLGVSMEALERRYLFATGDLDAAFGEAGLVIHELLGDSNSIQAIVEDSQGRLVTAGYTSIPNTERAALWVGRFLADGSVDTSFGENGNAYFDSTALAAVGNEVALQADGRIVIAGFVQTSTGEGPLDLGVWRFNADGSLDTTFGDEGMVRTNTAPGQEWSNALALTSDGKIVIAGTYEEIIEVAPDKWERPVMDAMIIRYNSDGSLDTTFGDDGIVRDSFDDNGYASDLHVQGDGKVVIGGGTYVEIEAPVGRTASNEFVIARYNVDGSHDTTFGDDGRAMTDFGDAYGGGDATAIHVNDDGVITAVGRMIPENFTDGIQEAFIAFARFTADGQLDDTFGAGGVKTAEGLDYVWDMTGDDDGNLILFSSRPQGYDEHGSFISGGMRNEVEVSRFAGDGSLDETFGDGGYARTEIDLGEDNGIGGINGVLGRSVILTSDGGIVAAGMVHGSGYSDGLLARFLGEDTEPSTPTPPPTETPPEAPETPATERNAENPSVAPPVGVVGGLDDGNPFGADDSDESDSQSSLWSDDLLVSHVDSTGSEDPEEEDTFASMEWR
ncbi:MAG: hypothetical protein ABIP55_04245 [Tepidisphaeraceae bacterium]